MSHGAYHRDPAVWVGEAEGTAKVCQRPMFKFGIIKLKMNKCLLLVFTQFASTLPLQTTC